MVSHSHHPKVLLPTKWLNGLPASGSKEVIQPQVPLRLPCYDLVLVTELAFGAVPPEGLDIATSSTPRFHGLTGGVYKDQEHIHRVIADTRLLAIPASRRRIAAYDPN